jgi:two-component system chemotaxis sensor kinase CheA
MSAVPIVALSSHANPKDIARGREAGFTDYVTKLDPTALLNVLSRTHAEESRKEDAA